MPSYFLKAIIFIATACLSITISTAQKVKEPKPWSKEWEQLYEPFRIAGNLYYVGTYDLACYLITSSKGSILINTGLKSSEAQIKNNIKTLGFKFKDVKILLTTQAHYDHLGAMAAIKKKTSAIFMANTPEKEALETGGNSDYALGGQGSSFKPVPADKYLKDGDTIRLGETTLILLNHPGHTKGSCSYMLTVSDSVRSYKVLIANMPTIVTEKNFKELTAYPTAAPDYAYTLKSLKQLKFDIWVASHASQFNMHSKHKPGDVYNPLAFADRAGFDAYLKELQTEYEEKLKKDSGK